WETAARKTARGDRGLSRRGPAARHRNEATPESGAAQTRRAATHRPSNTGAACNVLPTTRVWPSRALRWSFQPQRIPTRRETGAVVATPPQLGSVNRGPSTLHEPQQHNPAGF